MAQLRQHVDEYARLDAQVLGVTAQQADAVADYLRREAIPLPVLIDADRAVTRRYGVYNLVSLEGINMPHNALFLLDPAGIIRQIHVSVQSTDMPDEAQVRAALEGMRNEE